MATQEANDLATELQERNVKEPLFLLNDLLTLNDAIKGSGEAELPEFIKAKCKLEEEVGESLVHNWSLVPHFSESEAKPLVTEIVKYLKEAK